MKLSPLPYPTAALPDRPSLLHQATLYESPSEYVARVAAFVAEGLAAGEPVMVLVPSHRLDLLAHGTDLLRQVTCAEDSKQFGRNPSQIIPAVTEFLMDHGRGPARLVQDPFWPDRPPQELVEALRHDSLVNLALADTDLRVLCPYDTGGALGTGVREAWHTHPELWVDGRLHLSDQYQDPVEFCAADRWRLDPPPLSVEVFEIRFNDLALLRRFVHRQGKTWGLSTERVDDLILAANELATNSLRYGGGEGVVRMWCHFGGIFCEVLDTGQISDPLVGRRPPGPSADARGLWLVNQLCDLVEQRSGAGGTQTRITMDC